MFKNLVEEGRYRTINSLVSNPAVVKMINGRFSRYAELLSLRYDGEGLHARARLLGSSEEVGVSVRRIAFAEDCSSVTLEGFHSAAPWCRNLLQDFVEGCRFDIPEAARLALRPLARLL